jgi:hypothetical protein
MTAPQSSRTQGPLPIQGEALSALAASLVAHLGRQPDWSELTAVVKPVAGPADGSVHLALRRTVRGEDRPEGIAGLLPADSAPARRALEAQRAMAGPAGAWLELRVTLHRSTDGKVTADASANYDREPGVLTEADRPFDAAACRDHLATFPRPAEAVPAWMAERLAGAPGAD